MGLNCGIVGLPNVGKSTLFSALTASQVEAANYPFCTIEPNVGVVAVPDERLNVLETLYQPEKIIPSVVEFVDIAGLVKGASQGEGLGNQFLGHIRQVGAIAHVVRCFVNDDIIHVHGKIDPLSDIQTVELELIYSDSETVQKRYKNLDKFLKSQDKEVISRAKAAKPILERLIKELDEGKPARHILSDKEDLDAIKDLQLLTLKPVIYVCNVDEDSLVNEDANPLVKIVKEYAKKEGSEVVVICGQIEKEISLLDTPEEKKEFMKEIGITESGLERLIKMGHKTLGLSTYFTAGKKEVRAWTFSQGIKAPQAAAIIHTDFEKGFIRVEVYSYEDAVQCGSEAKVKEKGRLRVEGKEYIVQDGDILHFRFNV
jgi:GTP-binding protein YchF